VCAHSARLRAALGVVDSVAVPYAVALTFDDGPDPRGTPAILDALAREGAVATFFLVGEQVRAAPSLAAEIVAAGHDVGLHADRHRSLLRLAPTQVLADLRRAQATIADACGRVPRLYRPPYGVLNGAALHHARRAGWATVLWSRWGRDWRPHATPESVAAEVTHRLCGGEILLLHDADRYATPGSWRTTLAALPAIVGAVEAAGLGFAKVA
jgi:peptidoglycan/xylan/chitin deacetylase (PgdA/CDA1 family)